MEAWPNELIVFQQHPYSFTSFAWPKVSKSLSNCSESWLSFSVEKNPKLLSKAFQDFSSGQLLLCSREEFHIMSPFLDKPRLKPGAGSWERSLFSSDCMLEGNSTAANYFMAYFKILDEISDSVVDVIILLQLSYCKTEPTWPFPGDISKISSVIYRFFVLVWQCSDQPCKIPQDKPLVSG